jgi:hypothetical protein
MYDIVKLIFEPYIPDKLQSGMWFLHKDRYDVLSIRELKAPPFNEENFIAENGYPVKPYLIDEGNPNLNNGYIVAFPQQIGWWDEGEHSDELYDVTIKEINRILEEDDGYVCVELECENCEEYEKIVPLLYNDKVTLRSLTDVQDEDEYDEEDDYKWDGTQDFSHLDDDEDEYEEDDEDYYEEDTQTETQFAPTTDEGDE